MTAARPAIVPIDAVLFDFGGTLDADGLPWKERIRQLYHDEGVAVSRERFDAVYYRADDDLVGAIAPTLGLDHTVSRLIDSVTHALGIDDATLARRVATRFVGDARTGLARNRGLLAALGARYKLGIVSNFYGNLSAVCEEALLSPFFRVVVDSAQVGVGKPDPRIFRLALDRLALAARQVVFVGDSAPRDMAGARAAGLQHIWLVAAPAPPLAPCCPGDQVIHSLRDLEALLL